MTREFLHHLRDTVILLGGGEQLAGMVATADHATQADVDELRRVNLLLIDRTKDRLMSLNSIKVEK